MRHQNPSPDSPLGTSICTSRWRARLLATCIFAALMLAAGSLSAQKVLLTPQIDMEFDRLAVRGTVDAVQIDYELREVDWQWARDYDFDLWVGVYSPASNGDQAGGDWKLERARAIGDRKGDVELSGGLSRNSDRLGICLVAATEGGHLSPGMGYVCEEPVEVAVRDGQLDWEGASKSVALRLEQNVDQAAWFRPELGFDTAMARSEAPTGGVEEGGFVVHEQPAPSDAQAQADGSGDGDSADRMPRIVIRGDAFGQDSDLGGERGGYGQRGIIVYVPGFLPGARSDRGIRGELDRFRQRRLERRRAFGPLDPFDARFDQDMFTEHPEDVFHRFRFPPGHFGRDAFGRPLREAVPAQPGAQPDAPRIDVTPGHK